VHSALAISETLLLNQGEAAIFSIEQLEELARDRAFRLGVNVVDVVSAQNLLLRFGATSESTFNRTIEVAADLAAVLGTNLTGATNILGRALQDPGRGMQLLRRSIGSLTDEQQELVKSHLEAGNAAGAQAELLNILEGAVGGAAEASADSTKRIGAAFKEFVTDVGQPFIRVLDAFTPAILLIAENMRQRLLPVLDGFTERLQNAAAAIVDIETGEFKVDSLGEAFRVALDELDIDFGGFVERTLDRMGSAFANAPTEDIADGLITVFERSIVVLAEQMPRLVAAIAAILIENAPEIVIGFGEGLVQAFIDNPLPLTAMVAGLGLLPRAAVNAIAGAFRVFPFVGRVAGLFIRATAGLGRLLVSPIRLALTSVFRLGIGALVRAVPLLIGGAVASLVGAILTGVAAGFGLNWLIERLAPGINRGIEAVGGALFDFGTAVVDFFVALPGQILDGLDIAVLAVFDFFRELPNRIFTAIGNLALTLPGRGREIIQGLRDGIVDRFQAVRAFVVGIPGRIVAALSNAPRALLSRGREFISGLLNGVVSRLGALFSNVRAIPGSIARAIGNLAGTLVQAGRNLMAGLLRGIREAINGGVLGFVRGIASTIARFKGPLDEDLRLLQPAG
jgi:phage-related protein